MPWGVDDVDKHKKDLSDADKKKWVKVANAALASCEAKGDDDCEGKAVRIANAAVEESGHRTLGAWLRELVESAQRLLTGGLDLGEALDLSHSEMHDLLRKAVSATVGDDRWVWIRDVYDSYFVYNDDKDNKSYKRTYVIDSETAAVTLGDPVEVIGQTSWVPVGEAAMLESECIPLVEKAVRKDGTIPVKIIQPGWGTSGYYSPEVLKRDGPKVFTKGLHSYWDHPTTTEEAERPERSVRDLAAVLATDARYEEKGKAGPGLYADAQVFAPYQTAVEELAPHIGVSIRALGRANAGEAEGRQGPVIEEIVAARSVDFVTVPGAGGQVLQLFEAARGSKPAPTHHEEVKTVDEKEAQALREANTALQAEVARLKEGQLLREAKDFVATTLAGREMPDLTRARLVEALAAKPVLKDGAIDPDAYKAAIEAAATAEIEYLAKATGSGQIKGMGDSTPAPGASIKESWVTYYRRLGKTQAEAEQLAGLVA